jgi:hypothetical protein
MAIKSLSRSTINQSFRNNSALAGYEPNHFYHLETVRLGGNAASVEFTNLARYNDFQHFQIRATLRTNRANNGDALRLRFNNDSGTNYSVHVLRGEGSNTLFSEGGGSINYLEIAYSEAANNTASSFAGAVIDILDPFETTKNTTARGLSGYTSSVGRLTYYSGAWYNAAALTTILCYPAHGSAWVQGTRISLYGLKAKA